MKKFIYLLIFLTLTFIFVSCGSEKNELVGHYITKVDTSSKKKWTEIDINRNGKIYNIKVKHISKYLSNDGWKISENYTYTFTGEIIEETRGKNIVKMVPSENLEVYKLRNKEKELVIIQYFKDADLKQLKYTNARTIETFGKIVEDYITLSTRYSNIDIFVQGMRSE